jgi:hypothetical protein
MTALVDVGIPTHGGPRFLRSAIESVVGQTLADWRLTISANGPGSADIRGLIEPYLEDERVRFVSTEELIGGPANAARAMEGTGAPYTALLHDDDGWHPGFLERRVAFLEAERSCGYVFSACDFIDEAGHVLFRFDPGCTEGVQPRFFLRKLYRHNVVAIPTVLARRSSLDGVWPSMTRGILFYDYELWLRLAALFDVGYLDAADASYRLHSAQATHDESHQMGEHRLRLLDQVEPFMVAHLPSREIRRARACALLHASADAARDREPGAALHTFWRALRTHPAALVDPVVARLVAGSLRQQSRQRAAWKRAQSSPSASAERALEVVGRSDGERD